MEQRVDAVEVCDASRDKTFVTALYSFSFIIFLISFTLQCRLFPNHTTGKTHFRGIFPRAFYVTVGLPLVLATCSLLFACGESRGGGEWEGLLGPVAGPGARCTRAHGLTCITRQRSRSQSTASEIEERCFSDCITCAAGFKYGRCYMYVHSCMNMCVTV